MKDSVFTQNKDYLQTLLSQNQDIGIVIGEPNTLDKVASGLSLYLAFLASQKNVQVVSKRDPIVEVSSLVGVDKIKKSFDGVINTLTIAIPYRDGEVEKVSYNIEGDRLNVNLVATNKGITFKEQDIQYIKKGSSPSLIIAVGVSNPNDLVEMVGDTNIRVVNIDNNSQNQQYGDILFTDRSFSSISEIVGKLLHELALPIDLDIAQNLIDGMTFATNSFTSPNTSAYAFEATGFLMKSGARRRQLRTQDRQPSGFDRRQPHQPSHQQARDRGQNRMQPQIRSSQAFPQTREASPAATIQSFTQPQVRNDQESQAQVAPVQTPHSFEQAQPQVQPLDHSDQVPQDWFTPKIFRGAKTGNEQQ